MMKKLYKNYLLPLAVVLALALLAPAAYAEEAAITGEPYYGTDYVQFALNGSEEFFYDVKAGDAVIAEHVYYDGNPATVGWEVGGNDPLTYEITAYRGRTASSANTVATATVSGVYARLLGADGNVAAEVLMGLYPAMPADGGSFTAPATYYYNGIDYDITGAAAAENGGLYYTYAPYAQPGLTGSITYVDETGAVLATEEIPGIAEGSPVTVSLAAQKTFDGQTYNRSTGLEQVTAVYDGQIDFTVLYTRQRAEGEGAFTATFNFKDAATGALLTTDSVRVTRSYTYSYTAPQTFALTKDGQTTIYTAQAAAQLSYSLHLGDATTSYDILYDASGSDAQAVSWAVIRVNGVTGAQLDTQLVTVANGTTGSYHAADMTVDGETWEPVGSRDYTYTYGEGEPVQYIYYVPAGYTPQGNYTVTLQYLNIADNTVLYSESITVAPGADTLINSTASYTADGNEYVRLSGQQDTYRHSYYSPKRTYTIYYRNVNDTLYSDTVITVVQTITTERETERVVYVNEGATVVVDNGTVDNGTINNGTTGTTGGTTGGAANGGAAGGAAAGGGAGFEAGPTAGQELTGVANDTTGQNELRTEQGNDTATEREIIEEDETPLAGGEATAADAAEPETTGSFANMAARAAVLGVGAVILVLIILILRQAYKNRRRDS